MKFKDYLDIKYNNDWFKGVIFGFLFPYSIIVILFDYINYRGMKK